MLRKYVLGIVAMCFCLLLMAPPLAAPRVDGFVDIRKKPDSHQTDNTVRIIYSVGLDWARPQTLPKDI